MPDNEYYFIFNLHLITEIQSVVGNAFATVLNSNKVDKPKLSQYQFAVGQAEFSTGHVLKNNKSLYLVGEHISDAYEIFNSYDEAREFSIKQVNDNPEIECYVYDYNEQVLFICDKDGERNLR